MGERCLPETRGAVEEKMLMRFTAHLRGGKRHGQFSTTARCPMYSSIVFGRRLQVKFSSSPGTPRLSLFARDSQLTPDHRTRLLCLLIHTHLWMQSPAHRCRLAIPHRKTAYFFPPDSGIFLNEGVRSDNIRPLSHRTGNEFTRLGIGILELYEDEVRLLLILPFRQRRIPCATASLSVSCAKTATFPAAP